MTDRVRTQRSSGISIKLFVLQQESRRLFLAAIIPSGTLQLGSSSRNESRTTRTGTEWERTRRYGVNGLAHQMSQHRTFLAYRPRLRSSYYFGRLASDKPMDGRGSAQRHIVISLAGSSCRHAGDKVRNEGSHASGIPGRTRFSGTSYEWNELRQNGDFNLRMKLSASTTGVVGLRELHHFRFEL